MKKIRLESHDPCERFWHQVRVSATVGGLLLLFSLICAVGV